VLLKVQPGGARSGAVSVVYDAEPARAGVHATARPDDAVPDHARAVRRGDVLTRERGQPVTWRLPQRKAAHDGHLGRATGRSSPARAAGSGSRLRRPTAC